MYIFKMIQKSKPSGCLSFSFTNMVTEDERKMKRERKKRENRQSSETRVMIEHMKKGRQRKQDGRKGWTDGNRENRK